MKLTILDRYLIWGLYKTFLAVTVILILIIFANNFVSSLERIVEGYYKSEDLWLMMGLELVEMIGFLIPPSFFFAILISLGRLYRDSEVIAMQASGIGPVSFYRSYLLGVMPVVIVTATLVFQALPWSKTKLSHLKANAGQEVISIGVIETGRFQELRKGDTIFFAESHGRNEGEIKDIFIQNRRNGKLGIISAKEGYQYVDEATGDHYMVLKNGYRYTGEPGQNKYVSSSFHEYGIRIRRLEQKQTNVSVKGTPTSQLWGAKEIAERTELQYRLSIPLALVALTFLGIPLSRSLPRQGIYGRLFLAFIVYFSFMNVHSLAHNWMEEGASPAWLGMWWLPMIAVLLGFIIELRDRYVYLLNWKTFTRMLRQA